METFTNPLPNAWKPLLDDFLGYLTLEKGLSPATREGYGQDLTDFARYQAPHHLTWLTITPTHVSAWLADLAAEGYALTSIARKLSALRAIAAFLVRERHRPDDFTALLKGPRTHRKLPGMLSPPQVEALLQAPSENTPNGLRDRAMLELMYSAGLRISELCNLQLNDLNPQAGFVRVMGKGRKERLAPVGQPAIAAIQRYLQAGRPHLVRPKTGSHLFLSGWGRGISRKTFWLAVHQHAQHAGIEQPVKPHLLRHSFATHMLLGGADLRVVQEILGHADISTTEIYTHVANHDLLDEHALHHPRNHPPPPAPLNPQ